MLQKSIDLKGVTVFDMYDEEYPGAWDYGVFFVLVWWIVLAFGDFAVHGFFEFSYWPDLAVHGGFILLGILAPVLLYRFSSRKSRERKSIKK